MKLFKKKSVILSALCCMALACTTAGVMVSSVSAVGETSYTDADGVDVANWSFDSNGISPKYVYTSVDDGEKTALANYGMYNNAEGYAEGEESSSFTMLGGSYILLGNGFDVNHPITMKFKVIENEYWKPRFVISAFDSLETLFSSGQSVWIGSEFNIWSCLDSTNAAYSYMYHKLNVGNSNSAEVDYLNDYATVEIGIGENAADSYIKLNDTKFATLPVSRSDFANGKIYFDIVSFDTAFGGYFKIYQDIEYDVTFASTITDFSMSPVKVKGNQLLSEPIAPSIDGYQFKGWYDDPLGVNAHDFTQPVNSNMTIHACYESLTATYVNVTLNSSLGNFEPTVVKTEAGAAMSNPGQVFAYKGWEIVAWEFNGQTYDFSEVVNEPITLTAVWEESRLELYHSLNRIVDETWMYQYGKHDENGWDDEFMDWDNYDEDNPNMEESYVDGDGNTVLTRYGGTQHDDSFFIDENGRTCLLMVGDNESNWHITNLYKIDLTKELIVEFAWDNWDFSNGTDRNESMVYFQLVDSLATAFSLDDPNKAGAIAGVRTSNKPTSDLLGVFECLTTGAKSSKLDNVCVPDTANGGETYREEARRRNYTIRMFISEDGTQNYLYVDDVQIAGGLAGVKRSDFFGGYAYLHMLNVGSTNRYGTMIKQQFATHFNSAENGTYTTNVANDALSNFKDTISITATPAEGYILKCVKVGDNEYFPLEENYVEYEKGWGDEVVSVEFAKRNIVTFDTRGGNAIPAQEVVTGGYINKPSNPKQDGKKFRGWFTDTTWTTEFDFNAPVTADVTIYARWDDDKVASGGSSSGGNKNDNNETYEEEGCAGGCICSVSTLGAVGVVLASLVCVHIIKKRKEV